MALDPWNEIRRLQKQIAALGGSVSVAWGSITGKPSTFPPDSHTQAASTISDSSAAGRAMLTAATAAAQKTLLDLTGINSGDQTSIVGITGTKAQFNTAVTDGDFLYVGDVTSNATHTGDVTGSTALTIANDAVTYAKMQNVSATSRFIGRITAGSGDPEELTGTQATTLLDTFTTSLKGLAPASGGGTSNFLRADGTWAAPSGGSDPWSYVALASNSTVSTTALADVTGMSFTALADTAYEVEIFGAFQTAATTTGIGIALNIPSGSVYGMAFAPSATTTAMITQNLADDTVLAPTTAVAAANTNYALFGKYLVLVGGSGGTVQLRQRSEVAASNSVILAGTRMKWRAI